MPELCTRFGQSPDTPMTEYKDAGPVDSYPRTILQKVTPGENPTSLAGDSEEEGLNELQRELESAWKDSESIEDPESLCANEHRIRALQLLDDPNPEILRYSNVRREALEDELKTRVKVFLNAEISFDPRVGNERPPNECVPGTRDYILDEIGSWARDFEQPSVYWLNGLAGTGKSTIALTLAKKIESVDGGWVCKFFCSRKSEGSGKPLNIFSVLARLLAHKYTAFGLMYILAIDSNPGILDSPPRDQMNELLIEPLKKSGISAVIMIDGLDLCDKETVSAILGSLAESAPKIPQVKFLITSRPTPHIREGFGPLVKSGHVTIFDLHKVDPGEVNNDILLLFKKIFSEIRDRDQLDNDWPAEEFPYKFCKRADGLLAYAAAEARYMNPGGMVFAEDQPGELVNQTEGEFLEENAHWEKEKSICALYMSVLQDAFGDWKPGDDQKVRSVLGVIALAERFLSPSAIATLLGFDREHVLLCLKSAEPLLFLHEDSPVKPLHKSFAVFLTDQNLCKDEKFYVSPPIHHEELLIGCLKLMNNGLKENMCEFSCAFEYAWASWDTHLAGTTETQNVSNIIEHLHPFLEQNILNCQKAPRGVTGDAMNALEKWSLQVDSPGTLSLMNKLYQAQSR